jgi:hypothetical protein
VWVRLESVFEQHGEQRGEWIVASLDVGVERCRVAGYIPEPIARVVVAGDDGAIVLGAGLVRELAVRAFLVVSRGVVFLIQIRLDVSFDELLAFFVVVIQRAPAPGCGPVRCAGERRRPLRLM